jgi:peptidyl-prolyl cis-trans isomerase C
MKQGKFERFLFMNITHNLIRLAALTCLLSTANAAPTDVVARVNGKEITRADLAAAEKEVPPQLLEKAPDKKKLEQYLLNQLIVKELLKEAAYQAGEDKKESVKKEIDLAKDLVVMQAFVVDQLKPKVNEQAFEKEYSELKAKFPKNKQETRIAHILVKNEKKAKDAITRLKAGEDFGKVARELSEDEDTKKEGGELGFFVEGSFVPEIETAIKDLKPGTFTPEPVKTNFGYHVIMVEERRIAKPPKFEDVKQQIAALVQQKAMNELVEKLREKAKIENLIPEAGAKENPEAGTKERKG